MVSGSVGDRLRGSKGFSSLPLPVFLECFLGILLPRLGLLCWFWFVLEPCVSLLGVGFCKKVLFIEFQVARVCWLSGLIGQ